MKQTVWMLSIAVSLVTTQVFAANWPAWRGPDGTGVSSEKSVPTVWSSSKNVHWKVALPGEGNSAPIVWNDRVFVTCAIDKGKIRSLICFDRNSGKQLWDHKIPFPQKETTHRDNPFCSGSPATDGKHVYASFGSVGVLAYDFDGNFVWHNKLGKLTHVFGQATTPVLYKDLVIVHRGPGEPTHIVALNKTTGKVVWKTDQRAKNHNLYGSWSTPLIHRVGDHDELIVSMPEEIKGFDPNTGKELWRCTGLGTEVYTMPTIGDNLVVGISGHNGPAMAVRPGGTGDVTKSHRLWVTPRNAQRVGSAVIHNGYLYVSNATGIIECIVAKTGKLVWKERVGGTLWGSMLLANGKLYVSNQQGEIFVFDSGPKFNLIAKNEMKEHMKAALSPSDGQLFIRTYKNLYCIGQRNAVSQSSKNSKNATKQASRTPSQTIEGLRKLRARLKQNERGEIVTVNLGETNTTDAGLVYVQGLIHVRELDLYRTKVTDAGMVHLKGLTKLEKLYLTDTKVTDAGLRNLANLKQLTLVGLSGTNITDAGLESLKRLPRLKQLYLIGTNVTDAGVRKLQRALPDCDIAN